MRSPKGSEPAGGRVVKHRLADGTVKIYRYGRRGGAKPDPKDSVRALVTAYQHSQEWRELAPGTQKLRSIYLQPVIDMGATPCREVTRESLLTLRDAMAEGSGPGAASNLVWAAQALFSWALDRKWVSFSPAYKIKTPKLGSIKAWTREEADFAVRRLPEHLRRAVVLARYTGQRRGDLCKMVWGDYDGKTISVVPEKTSDAKTLPLIIKAHPKLRNYLDSCDREADHILVNTARNPWVTPTNLSTALSNAMITICMSEDLTLHGLRKLAATELAEAGCTPSQISAVTGHKTLKEIERYTRSASQRDLAAQAIDRLSEQDAKRQKILEKCHKIK
jgi:integrase